MHNLESACYQYLFLIFLLLFRLPKIHSRINELKASIIIPDGDMQKMADLTADMSMIGYLLANTAFQYLKKEVLLNCFGCINDTTDDHSCLKPSTSEGEAEMAMNAWSMVTARTVNSVYVSAGMPQPDLDYDRLKDEKPDIRQIISPVHVPVNIQNIFVEFRKTVYFEL